MENKNNVMLKPIAEHRTIRKFTDKPIPEEVMRTMLTAATRASTTGGLQLYSIIVSQEKSAIATLAECHYNQVPARQAAAIVTFCADINRLNKWSRLREATPGYNNLGWWINAATDAILASQNFALEAVNQKLGICYLGTISGNAAKITDILSLPIGVVPVVTIAVGYPDENPSLTPRLPLEAVVHNEAYVDYRDADIDNIYHDLENLDNIKEMIKSKNLPSYSHFFTDIMYSKEGNEANSKAYFDLLKKQGFIEF